MPTYVMRETDKVARRWVQKLSDMRGEKTTPASAGALGVKVARELEIPLEHAVAIGSLLTPLLDKVITAYSLYRCGLYLATNGKQLQQLNIPRSLESVPFPLKEPVWVKVVSVLPGPTMGLKIKLWNITLLLASSKLAGMEVAVTAGAWVTERMRAKIGLTCNVRDYPEYMVGGTAQLTLDRRGKGGLVILALISGVIVQNKRLRKIRLACPNFPCHLCNKGLDACKCAIKSFTEKKKPCPTNQSLKSGGATTVVSTPPTGTSSTPPFPY